MSKQNKGRVIGWLMLKYNNGHHWPVINNNPGYLFGYEFPDGKQIIIPHEFVTDFASIPRMFWKLAPPVGYGARAAYGKAAVIHDYLYRNKILSRKEADNIFLQCMKDSGVHVLRRYLMWFAVRAFGWISYHR